MTLQTKDLVKRTYFGIVALLLAILSVMFLAAFFAVSQLNINPDTFFFWNNITAAVYCLVTPAAFVLAMLAWRRKRDSRILAGMAVAVTVIPFLILFVQFIFAFMP